MLARKFHLGSFLLPWVLIACGGQALPADAPKSAEAANTAADSGDGGLESDRSQPRAEDEPRSTNGVTGVPSADHAVLWEQFILDWNKHQPSALARWGAPAGVLILDNPGAFVRVRLLKDAPALFTQDGHLDGARIKRMVLSASIDAGLIPKTNCEGEGEVKSGVFLQASDRAHLDQMIDAMERYELAPVEEVARIKAAFGESSTLQLFTVADTLQSVSFIFGLDEHGVVLVAVDAVVPCSA